MGDMEVPVPPQWKPQPITDFRGMEDGPRGFKVSVTKKGRLGSKRKLEEYADQVEVEEAADAPMDAVAVDFAPTKRSRSNVVGVGKASGRTWKLPGQRAASLRNPKLSSSWEKKMADKAKAQAFKEAKKEAKALVSEAKREARERKEAAKERKEENRRKSEVTVRVSAATAKKMLKSKKDRKKLRAGGV